MSPTGKSSSRLLTLATAGVLVAGLWVGAGVAPSSADDGSRDTAQRASSLPGSGGKSGYRGRNQTSDGKPGLLVGPEVDLRGKVQVKNDTSYEIAPGITLREWDQVDGRQPIGQVRMNLLTVNLDAPNITFAPLSPSYVTSRRYTSQLARWSSALAAVNGDFFDIGDTDAPKGVTIDDGTVLTGSRDGWIPGVNSTLWWDGAGPHVSPLSVQYTIKQRRQWVVSGLNHFRVPKGQIGIFDHEWNRTKGYSVTDGKKFAREVVIRKNRVISNRSKLSSGRKIRSRDTVLIGVGSAASQLSNLRKGKKITFLKRIQRTEGYRPRFAISGDRPLLVDNVRTVINNTIAHPRTAVGIDADGRKLLILVVDGRSQYSRGYTMVELADIMTALGAENAINLDGGGSSAMWSRNATGGSSIVNEPSDGAERKVANAFGVFYHAELPPVVPILPTPTPTPTPAPTPAPPPTSTTPAP